MNNPIHQAPAAHPCLRRGEQKDKPLSLGTVMECLAQSAFGQSPAAAGIDLSTEIIVRMLPNIGLAEYQGTRSALEAEGVVPAGTNWPEGFEALRWEDGKFRYWLRRERPEGVKGPRKLFLDVDWWMLEFWPVKARSREVQLVGQKAAALAFEIYRQSPEGRAEWEEHWNAYLQAKKDEKFQAFKSLIPGINRPKRGGRPKRADQDQVSNAA